MTSPDPVTAARRVAAAVLAPAAAATDRADAIPAANLDALARAGLYGLMGPTSCGGLAADLSSTRQVYEALAGACGATFFLWVQHHALVRTLAFSPNEELRASLLPRLCRGEVRAGVAFAHLRRSGPPAIRAAGEGDGWRLSGRAPWMSGWGLVDLMLVAAVSGDEVVWCVVPAADGGGVSGSAPLDLSVLQATRTVRVDFEDTPVAAGDVVLVESLAEWRGRDRVTTAQPNPAAFGVAGTAIRLLEEAAPGAAKRLAGELEACRNHAYGVGEDMEALVRARAWGLDLAVRAALALVTASGGAAMELGHPAQRLAREAAFYLVQAQTAAGREASLDVLAGRR